MSIEKEISCKGKVVYFTLGSKTNAEKLKEALEDIGLKSFAPDNNTKKSALKQALLSVCANRRRLVRPLVGERGYAVVTEKKDADGTSLEHTIDFDVLLPDGADYPICRCPVTGNVFSPHEEDALMHRFQIELERLPSNKVSLALVKIIDHMHGVSLRDTGGVYWIPQGAVSRFEEVAKAIEEASDDSSNIVYSMRTAMDEDLRASVIGALARTMENEVSTIEAEALNGELGKRAIDTKKKRCNKLRHRIIGYQKMFSVTLTELEEHLGTVESSLAVNTFAGFGA